MENGPGSWVASAISLVGVIFTGVVAYLIARLNAKATSAASHAEEVKTSLAASNASTRGQLQSIAATGQMTHALVNNAMAIQLEMNMKVTKRLAELTGDPEDIAAAEASERAYREHVIKQDAADLFQSGK